MNFIFQPAEEGLGGADAMIKDGLFERFPCDAVFGMHNRPGLPVGKFSIRTGAMMAGGAYFDITVVGRGAGDEARGPSPASIRCWSRRTSPPRCSRSSRARQADRHRGG
ncbi:MAG: M20/M25/M40 family metallo-hydrolase [Pseudomonadota bacterium]